MDELGVLLEPNVESKEVTYTTKTSNAGKVRELVTVQADMVMTWVDAETGDERQVTFACFGTQDDISKAFGSALTYSERFFLLKYFNIPTDKDDPDSFQEKTDEAVAKEPEVVDDKKLSVYNEAAGKCKTSDEVNAWMEENAAKIKEELNNTERAILRDTCLKIKIILDTVTDE
jgi:hypothetical protein